MLGRGPGIAVPPGAAGGSKINMTIVTKSNSFAQNDAPGSSDRSPILKENTDLKLRSKCLNFGGDPPLRRRYFQSCYFCAIFASSILRAVLSFLWRVDRLQILVGGSKEHH